MSTRCSQALIVPEVKKNFSTPLMLTEIVTCESELAQLSYKTCYAIGLLFSRNLLFVLHNSNFAPGSCTA